MPVSILVIERDDLVRATLVSMLDSMKFHAFGMSDAQRAYRILELKQFKAVIGSPDVDDLTGADFAVEPKIRQPFIKVIVVGSGPPHKQLSMHVDAFVQKPLDLDTVHRAIIEVTTRQNFR